MWTCDSHGGPVRDKDTCFCRSCMQFDRVQAATDKADAIRMLLRRAIEFSASDPARSQLLAGSAWTAAEELGALLRIVADPDHKKK